MPRKVIEVIGIMLCFVVASCNLFKTRTADAPTQVSSSNVPATDALLVFQNMIYAFQEADAFHYSQTISDSSFTFIASGNAKNRYVELTDWNKTKEEKYFTKVIGSLPKNSKVSLEFTTIASTNYFDSCEFVRTYLLNVPNAVTGDPAKVYKGQAQFTLVRDPLKGSWYISSWTDYELNPSDSTWSDLKGSFVN